MSKIKDKERLRKFLFDFIENEDNSATARASASKVLSDLLFKDTEVSTPVKSSDSSEFDKMLRLAI